MNEQLFSVSGMTCGNCVRHVTEALREIPGVRDVTVTLEDGRAVVHAERPLGDDEVRAALDEAGYSLA